MSYVFMDDASVQTDSRVLDVTKTLMNVQHLTMCMVVLMVVEIPTVLTSVSVHQDINRSPIREPV